MKNNQKITIKKLGEILQLDPSSISLALRDSAKISVATRQRVKEIATKYNYLPNLAARQLRSSSPQLVGLVLPDVMDDLTNPMAARTIKLLAERCTARGIVFQILSANNLINTSVNEPRYGLLPETMFIWGDVPRSVVERQVESGRTVLVIDPNHLSYSTFSGPAVVIDNFNGGALVARHLVEQGAQRLLLIQVRADHLGHQARLEGARKEWRASFPVTSATQCGLAELSDEDLAGFAEGKQGAIFCSNDWGALQIWHRLTKLGLAMPRDVRLAGFDGEEAALMAGITTMLFDWGKAAEAAFNLLLQTTGDDKHPFSNSSFLITTILRKGQTT